MKVMGLTGCLLLIGTRLLAQDTVSVIHADTASKDPFRIYNWKEKQKDEFEVTVQGYDSLKLGNNAFQDFYYFTSDKPDGRLTVRDEHGNKVRQCIYKNKLMVKEQWWFSSGIPEFEGTWSEKADAYGDQALVEYKWYYRNKKLRKHGFYNGVTITYYPNGLRESEKTFREGKANGPFKEYFPNGKLQSEGQYTDGSKSGEWTYYNMDGTVRERVH